MGKNKLFLIFRHKKLNIIERWNILQGKPSHWVEYKPINQENLIYIDLFSLYQFDLRHCTKKSLTFCKFCEEMYDFSSAAEGIIFSY